MPGRLLEVEFAQRAERAHPLRGWRVKLMRCSPSAHPTPTSAPIMSDFNCIIQGITCLLIKSAFRDRNPTLSRLMAVVDGRIGSHSACVPGAKKNERPLYAPTHAPEQSASCETSTRPDIHFWRLSSPPTEHGSAHRRVLLASPLAFTHRGGELLFHHQTPYFFCHACTGARETLLYPQSQRQHVAAFIISGDAFIH